MFPIKPIALSVAPCGTLAFRSLPHRAHDEEARNRFYSRDYDRDRLGDVYVIRENGPGQLLRRVRCGTVRESGPKSQGATMAAGWAGLDPDGLSDLDVQTVASHFVHRDLGASLFQRRPPLGPVKPIECAPRETIDAERSWGVVAGKAKLVLEAGAGLALALVSLQLGIAMKLGTLIVIGTALVSSAGAQEVSGRIPISDEVSWLLEQQERAPSREHVSGQLAAFRRKHGESWRVHLDPASGFCELLFGGSAGPGGNPVNDEDFVELANQYLGDTASLHGVDTATLFMVNTKVLPLGLTDSTDKVVVCYQQHAHGLRIRRSSVNVLMDMKGRLLSIQSIGIPGPIEAPEPESINSREAERIAVADFREVTGTTPTRIGEPGLIFEQVERAAGRDARLVWALSMHRIEEGSMPLGYNYFIDTADGLVVRREDAVHQFSQGSPSVTGLLHTNMSLGDLPDNSSNPPQLAPIPWVEVSGNGASYIASEGNGIFTLPGDYPTVVTADYKGRWEGWTPDLRPRIEAIDVSGVSSPQSLTLSSPAQVVEMNSFSGVPSSAYTAQANAFWHITKVFDWVHSVDPLDGTPFIYNPTYDARVNDSFSCNAVHVWITNPWAGFGIGPSPETYLSFGSSGSGCPNAAYSTVVAHELGHWLNVRYGTDNGSDGMGEGNADVWAMYVLGTPTVGKDFFGSGSKIRSGLNTRQFCGDSNGGCYGEVHADGEVWMGAAWKIR
ncbi:MAG: hypothetical protein ACI9F9_000378, partial [Candidatus Paceibacteria bacterium]